MTRALVLSSVLCLSAVVEGNCYLKGTVYDADRGLANRLGLPNRCASNRSKGSCHSMKHPNTGASGICEWYVVGRAEAGRAEEDVARAVEEEMACYAMAGAGYKEVCESKKSRDACYEVKGTATVGDNYACNWRPKIVDPTTIKGACAGKISGLNAKCAKGNASEAECDKIKSIFGKPYCVWNGGKSSRGAETDFAATSGLVMGAVLAVGALAVFVVTCTRKGQAAAVAAEQTELIA